MKIELKLFEHGSQDYYEALKLRDLILRKPLGLSIFDEQLDADVKSYHFGAYYENEMIGTLILTPISDLIIKMRQVAVDERFRKKGIGAQIVKHSEDFAHIKGFEKIVLNARKEAVLFYERQGYKIVSEEFIEVTILHQKMEKQIGNLKSNS